MTVVEVLDLAVGRELRAVCGVSQLALGCDPAESSSWPWKRTAGIAPMTGGWATAGPCRTMPARVRAASRWRWLTGRTRSRPRPACKSWAIMVVQQELKSTTAWLKFPGSASWPRGRSSLSAPRGFGAQLKDPTRVLACIFCGNSLVKTRRHVSVRQLVASRALEIIMRSSSERSWRVYSTQCSSLDTAMPRPPSAAPVPSRVLTARVRCEAKS